MYTFLLLLAIFFGLASPETTTTPSAYLGPGKKPLPVGNMKLEGFNFKNCQRYPYASPEESEGLLKIKSDFQKALDKGLSCLEGYGGYHANQAEKLRKLVGDPQQKKSILCSLGSDSALAKATSGPAPSGVVGDPHPSMRLNLTTIGDVHSDLRDDPMFAQYTEKQANKYLPRPWSHNKNIQQKQADVPKLLFHEMIHWLGHEHQVGQPDVALAYTFCCFGVGMSGKNSNELHANRKEVCEIVKDQKLWPPEENLSNWSHFNSRISEIKVIDEDN